ncbi:hypothetical protein WJX82_007207 [Trebouxia sp. C0006]
MSVCFRAGHVLPCRYKGVHKHKSSGKFEAHLWIGTTVSVTMDLPDPLEYIDDELFPFQH